MFLSARWVSTSLTQLNDNFILGILFALGSLAMVHIFPISFSLSFLTSCTPSLVAGFATWSSRGMALGSSDVGWCSMDGEGAVVTGFSGMLAGVANVVACIVFTSWAQTFNFRSLSISKTSFGNGIPSTFGHSHSSHCIFSLICSRVTVSGSHQFAGLVLVVCFWFPVMVSVGDMVTPFTLVSSALSFFCSIFPNIVHGCM